MWFGSDFLVANKKNVRCRECGRKAVFELIPDGFYDPPGSFSARVTCEGGCEPQRIHLTLKDVREKLGRPIEGWLP